VSLPSPLVFNEIIPLQEFGEAKILDNQMMEKPK
jgi:hypothetical protein